MIAVDYSCVNRRSNENCARRVHFTALLAYPALSALFIWAYYIQFVKKLSYVEKLKRMQAKV